MHGILYKLYLLICQINYDANYRCWTIEACYSRVNSGWLCIYGKFEESV